MQKAYQSSPKEVGAWMSNNEHSEAVERACAMGIIERLAEEYLNFCYTNDSKEKESESDEKTSTPKRKKEKEQSFRFPNIAGFCRYFGIGRSRYERLSKKYPEEFEKLLAVFEDEALNSQISPSLLTAYLKKRLGYGDTADAEKSEVDTGQLKLIFDHDLLSDGE